MSLIDEALKRARQEASRQDAAAREARYARVPTYVAPVRRSRSWLLPGVVAGCLVVGVAAGVLMSRRPEPVVEVQPAGPHPLSPSPASPPDLPGRGGTPAEVSAENETKGVQEPVIEEQVATVRPLPAPAAKASVVEQTPEPRSPSPGEGERGGGRGGQGVRASEPAPAPAPPAPVPAAPIGPIVDLPQPPPPEMRSYVREVPLEGGAVLRLDGIAFSEKPVALFGDKVLAPGESAGGGFTIVEIERKRVKLQGPGGAVVYVSLR